MNISLVSSIDASTERIRREVVPFAIDSLKRPYPANGALYKASLAQLRGSGFYQPDENVVMLISFDPCSCGVPKGHCGGGCESCYYNPLVGLLDPYSDNGPFVITRRETVNALLDTIGLLAAANKAALLRAGSAVEPPIDD